MLRRRFRRTLGGLAWRDLRNSKSRAIFIVIALAVSIAAITGVHGTAEAARRALSLDSRAWLAADVCVDTRDPIEEEQAAALNRLPGTSWTLMTTALTMASSDQAADRGMIQVKAIDPAVYPFYGGIELEPRQKLVSAVRADQIAVSPEVLERLAVRLGDSITIGGQALRIGAILRGEPDRFANEVAIGMRCMVSREAYARLRIEESEPIKNRILVRLSPEESIDAAAARLARIFPNGNLRDYRGAHRQETRITELVISFVSLAAFLSLALGAMGVATAIRQHAEHALPTLAILKMLGARPRSLAGFLFLQIGLLAAAAIALGIPLGAMVSRAMLAIVGRYLVLPDGSGASLASELGISLATMMAMAPVLAQPARWIRDLRPAVVLRKNMWGSGAERSAPGRGPGMWIAGAVATGGLAALGSAMLDSAASAAVLAAVIAGIAGGAALLGMLALRLLRRAAAAHPKRRVSLIRHGIACLYRPGNRSVMLIAALASALTMMIATLEAKTAVLGSIAELFPYEPDGLYLIGFRNSMRQNIVAFLQGLPGIDEVRILSQVRLHQRSFVLPPGVLTRVVRVEAPKGWKNVNAEGVCDRGETLDAIESGSAGCVPEASATAADPAGSDLRAKLLRASEGMNRRTADEWNYFCAEITGIRNLPELFPPGHREQAMTVDYYLEQLALAGSAGLSVLAQCNASLASRAGPTAVVLPREAADAMRAAVGTHLYFDVRDQTLETVVAAIRELPPSERLWATMEMDCATIDERNLIRQAVIRARPDRLAEARRAILDNYPTLGVVTSEEINREVGALTQDATGLVRAAAWCAMVSGLLVLVGMVAATRPARSSEIGIYSALGARRVTIVKIYSAEFGALGVSAGVVAATLAGGFTAVAIRVALHRGGGIVDWRTLAMVIGISAVAAALAGWIPTYRLVARKPMDVLREE